MTTLFGRNLETIYTEHKTNEQKNPFRDISEEKEAREFKKIKLNEKKLLTEMIYMDKVERNTDLTKKYYRYIDHYQKWANAIWCKSFTSKEVFVLIMDYHEGHFESETHLEIIRDIMSNGKEFMHSSLGLSREKVYFREDNSSQISGGFKNLDHHGIMPGLNQISDINESCPGLIQPLFGRSYEHLPDYFKNKDTEPLIWMPDDSEMWMWTLTIEYVDPRFIIRTQEDKAALRGALHNRTF